MTRMKSITIKTELDTAKRTHNCRANKQHQICAGEQRLKIKNQRSWNHYCMVCAKKILQNDISKLTALQNKIMNILIR